MKPSKLYTQLLAYPNTIIRFGDFEALFTAFGFEARRGKGSHRNYKHPKVPVILTAQPRGKEPCRIRSSGFLRSLRSMTYISPSESAPLSYQRVLVRR
ncbi:MAG TPA: type II toxin-antitoxin system HicA family toxin [Sphingomicrobium sp.]|nr:type II toxin-antitoxin system HicA family toxin [Sphingomicrobium sp.]